MASAAAIALPIAGTMGSCVSCMMLVEKIAKADPGAMNLMTFSTFLFISIEGLIFYSKFLKVKNRIPIKGYAQLVVIFFLVNVVNNQALNYHVPVPLHIIFRSGSLLASLVLGVLILKRSYSRQKYVSVLMITLGIIICTLATQPNKVEHANDNYYAEWVLGIVMLTAALIASAYLGITQERLYATYGKHPREALFYVHALSLPAFALMGFDILAACRRFSVSAPISLPYLNAQLPELWVYLLLSDFAQYACIRCVYVLTAECTALTVTLVVTLRKFVSLVISIYVFENPFTVWHGVGTALVFAGTFMFAEFGKRKHAAPASKTLVNNDLVKKAELKDSKKKK